MKLSLLAEAGSEIKRKKRKEVQKNGPVQRGTNTYANGIYFCSEKADTSERARSHQSLVDADVILHIWGVFTE